MNDSKLETILRELISIQATDLSNETDNKVRLNSFYSAIEEAKEQLQIILEDADKEEAEYCEASNEADASLIAHVKRRV